MHPTTTSAYTEIAGMLTQVQQMAVQPDLPFNTIWNWQQPALSRLDLEAWIQSALSSLSRLPDNLNDETVTLLNRVVQQTSWFRGNALPNLPSASAMYVVPPLLELLERTEKIVDGVVPRYPTPPPPQPYPDWEQLEQDGYLPKKLADRLRGMEKRVDRLIPRTDDLEHKLGLVDDAFLSAERLPENLAALEESRREILSLRTEAQSLASQAATHTREAGMALEEIGKLATQSVEKYAELEDAHRAASTRGLASSFQKRASDLGWSVRMWVAVLVADLFAGAGIGYFRFEELQKVLASPQPAAVIWGNFVFSVLSVAAPVWLGWIATKQINQRFKLAEDYSFKATVASAYEAWKTEAQKQDFGKQDKNFEQRLFGTAMSRLEEAPLRFIEVENYGSPWHELLSSSAFATALAKVPELKSTVAAIIGNAGGAAVGFTAAMASLGSQSKTTDTETPPKRCDEAAI